MPLQTCRVLKRPAHEALLYEELRWSASSGSPIVIKRKAHHTFAGPPHAGGNLCLWDEDLFLIWEWVSLALILIKFLFDPSASRSRAKSVNSQGELRCPVRAPLNCCVVWAPGFLGLSKMRTTTAWLFRAQVLFRINIRKFAWQQLR